MSASPETLLRMRKSEVRLLSAAGAVLAAIAAIWFGLQPPGRPSEEPPSIQVSAAPAGSAESRPAPIPSAPLRAEVRPAPPNPSAPGTAQANSMPRVAEAVTGRLRVIVRDPWGRPAQAEVRAVPMSGSVGWAPREEIREISESHTSAAARAGERRPPVVREGGGMRPVASSEEMAEFVLPVGVPFRLEVKPVAVLFEPWFREWVYADSGEVLATLTAKCGRITGRVVAGESGVLLKGVALSWAVSSGGHNFTGVTRLEEGRLDVLAPAGEVRLEAAAPGRERVSKSVPVAAGESVQDVEFTLPRLPQVSLSGSVLDDTGAPVAGAKASLRTLVVQNVAGAKTTSRQDIGTVQADVAGKFQFSNLTPGSHLLSVRADGFEPTGSIALDVAAEGVEAEIVLSRAGALLVRAVDSDGRLLRPTRIVLGHADEVAIEAKHESGRLSVFREHRNSRAYGIVAATGEIGDYREREMAGRIPDRGDVISGVPPGEYDVLVEAPPLSGKTKVFVGAEGTTHLEVQCR